MVGARVRRQQVAYAEGRGLSRRRACALLSVARSTVGYVSRLIARDAPVLAPLRTLAGQYPRDGYRTIRIFLERQGHVLGTDRMYRLWRQERLQVPKKRPRRRVATSRPRPLPPTAVNHVWAYDFVFDNRDSSTVRLIPAPSRTAAARPIDYPPPSTRAMNMGCARRPRGNSANGRRPF